MKKKFIYLIVFIGLIFSSCSSDYDYSTDIDTNEISFVTLTTNEEDKRIFGNEETVTFHLINDSNNSDVSDAATFYIDGESILGNEFIFEETGTYTISANINDIQSNSLEIEIVGSNYVIVDSPKVLKGQTINFKSYSVNGSDITLESTFIVNNTPISGSEFQNNQTGMYNVKALYQGSNSNTANFKIFSLKNKVVLEDYTGDWCGWCPRVLLVVDEVKEVTDDVVVLAIHKNDVMESSQADALIDAFNVGASLPKLRANRTENINVIQDSQIPNAVQNITSQAGIEISVGLAINTKLNGNNLNVEVQILSEENLPSNYRLAVYLYQDNLVFPQTNYYNDIEGSKWYQQGEHIEDFVHNHVLETSLTNNILGDEIPTVSSYTVSSKNFGSIDLSGYAHYENGNTFDPNNFGVAVFLVDENNTAINAQAVKAGESIDFDE
ncbi:MULTISPECIES: Omp28-related outer membrane protein [Mesonia]|uniref:Uncharacterized protein n=1 Tax=Mesonia oceanica TaxID=2687242 RepID=A0AC61Y846_9FLAO|nr:MULTISPECIES: Omp28-related outer membrane protein [Mesonia]MAN26083.1 hypothetical protein [Mesonia sp.]MAQ42216.1 hypothetical protein [Mesonia sp.]MBJ97916.1 hypothetical protein [Flavobacteriaceae bacterium]VVV00083.1 hypothetical protein FVB9532_01348 [Mesonia oceanica]|tara:strand:- start:31800 stop:33116 length:1317 start_codon:yes stop_codon:yes gene_type:complete